MTLGPLCDTPVAIPPNEDPNIRMERHIQMECQVATGRKTKINSAPVCAKSHCGKKLLAPIKCPVSIKSFDQSKKRTFRDTNIGLQATILRDTSTFILA